MEQVGYDTYCNLLDEVMKEMQGIEVEEEPDIQIDMNISSYIPDEYIFESSQKIEVYQNIALCKTEEDIQNIHVMSEYNFDNATESRSAAAGAAGGAAGAAGGAAGGAAASK